MAPPRPEFFATPIRFRAWLAKHHATAAELLVGFYKRDSDHPSMSWPESVDEALCFGWIDGVRRRIDDVSYAIRFTPRRTSSIWSAVNIKRMAVLEDAGRMQQAGRDAFARRSDGKSRVYAYEQSHDTALDPAHQQKLEANSRAWRFFQAQAPWYRRRAIHRIVSAKRPETRIKRLDAMISAWAAGQSE
jgi:uncharacterized protein YdeI (YjbR/CyaY-like superfamily)